MAFENSSREFTFRRKIITFRVGSREFTYDLPGPVLLRLVEEEGGAGRNVVLYERAYSSDTPLFLRCFSALSSAALPLREIIQNRAAG